MKDQLSIECVHVSETMILVNTARAYRCSTFSAKSFLLLHAPTISTTLPGFSLFTEDSATSTLAVIDAQTDYKTTHTHYDTKQQYL